MSFRSALTGALKRFRALFVVSVPFLGHSAITRAMGFFAGGETRFGSDSVAWQATPAKVSLQPGATWKTDGRLLAMELKPGGGC
jgi:hypothetical protein